MQTVMEIDYIPDDILSVIFLYCETDYVKFIISRTCKNWCRLLSNEIISLEDLDCGAAHDGHNNILKWL